jgi:uncharacterized protein YjdB
MSRRFWVCVPLLLMCVLLASCGSNPAVTQLTITPSGATLSAVGQTTQFKATASYIKSNQTQFTQDVTSQVTWTSSNPAVATIDATGLAKAVSGGTAAVVATLKSGSTDSTTSANLTVNVASGGGIPPHELLSIAITPGSQTVTAADQTVQFIAIGTFSTAPTTQDLTQTATWSSSSPSVATIVSRGLQGGLATGKTPGTTTITATATSASGATIVGTATLTETGTTSASRDLVSISIIPTSQTLTAVGQTAKYTAIGNYTAAPTTAVLASATWDSSVKSVATIDANGLATATGPGTTAITATGTTQSGAKIVGTATLTENATAVTTHELVAVSVIPAAQPITSTGDTAQFVAVGTFNSAPVTALLPAGAVTWASSSVQYATIDPFSGLATAIGPGTTFITATTPSVSGATLVGVGSLTCCGTGQSQVPVLTVLKLGATAAAATITSNPASINCGVTCNATFPLGSSVTLTASTAPASWSSNCLNPLNANGGSSADGTQCVVTMSTNTTVAAVFN